MRRSFSPARAFIVGGFLASLFAGFLNPIYITRILASLDARVIAAGSVLSSAFPVLVGLALERRRVFQRLYALLPAVMLIELALTAVSAAVAEVDLSAYYLFTGMILGLFTSCVLYLLQKLKETKIRRNRAAFDRRVAVADGLGYLVGSAAGLTCTSVTMSPALIAALGAVQTAVVYGLLVVIFRRAPHRRRASRATEEEPHQCGAIEALEEGLLAA
jgi:hypothetical protein